MKTELSLKLPSMDSQINVFMGREYIQTLFKKIDLHKNNKNRQLNFCNILRSFNDTIKETNKDKK
jgi:hypothetical protein